MSAAGRGVGEALLSPTNNSSRLGSGSGRARAESLESREPFEDFREASRDRVLDVAHRNRLAGDLERRDPTVGDSAGNNQLEVIEIGADVESEPVARDPARDANPDRADLRSHPGTGEP